MARNGRSVKRAMSSGPAAVPGLESRFGERRDRG